MASWSQIQSQLFEAKEHPAYSDLMGLAKKLDNRDTRAIQVLAGKINNFTATGNRGMMADMAKAMKALDDDSHAAVMKIMNKHDKALAKSIHAKMGMKESVELDEAAPKISTGKAKGSIKATGLRGKGMKKFDVDVSVKNGKFEFRITDESGRFQTVGLKQAAKMLGESVEDLESFAKENFSQGAELSTINEKLTVPMGIEAWIRDFLKSDAPQFQGKSKDDKIKMAVAAFQAAEKEMKSAGKKEKSVDEAYKGTKKEFEYEVELAVDNMGFNNKSIRRVMKKGKGYEVSLSLYMGKDAHQKIADQTGTKLVGFEKKASATVGIYEATELDERSPLADLKVKFMKTFNKNYEKALKWMKDTGKSAADAERMFRGVDARELQKMMDAMQ